ncbi:riboflavin deaminase [Hydrococcus rivularis NIES-593]|uniref:Riboflavin deaminase n=1 Tax=Hydrococcus rivularis NIES-593 TaxID=1921803 RepID=A0A1U7H9S5_9CYAN|nr:RibD family protein [Hydrococcus rivularis]OKH20285.1 riboflavin deaminase [Hydrococcus rivularis NIES-593]
MNRPFTTVILAMTADGKIADVGRSPARFSSAADKAHLEKQISLADGVLFGAGTLRAYGTTLPIRDPQFLQARERQQKPPQPIHILCSASAQIDPQLPFFRQPVPRWLLATAAGAKLWRESKQEGFDRILVADARETFETGRRGDGETGGQGVWGVWGELGDNRSKIQNPKSKIDQSPISNPTSIDWIDALAQLKELGLQRLAILGGGELVASLLAEDLIDEFWLTLCPLILGGATAPTPVEGMGFLAREARRLELLSVERIEGEIFLHYRLQR